MQDDGNMYGIDKGATCQAQVTVLLDLGVPVPLDRAALLLKRATNFLILKLIPIPSKSGGENFFITGHCTWQDFLVPN